MRKTRRPEWSTDALTSQVVVDAEARLVKADSAVELVHSAAADSAVAVVDSEVLAAADSEALVAVELDSAAAAVADLVAAALVVGEPVVAGVPLASSRLLLDEKRSAVSNLNKGFDYGMRNDRILQSVLIESKILAARDDRPLSLTRAFGILDARLVESSLRQTPKVLTNSATTQYAGTTLP